MRELGPTFIDITWGAGGTRADTTAQFVKAAHEEFGLETCMHLTCTDMPRDQVDKALEVCIIAFSFPYSSDLSTYFSFFFFHLLSSRLPPLTVTDILCVTLFFGTQGRIQFWLPQHPSITR